MESLQPFLDSIYFGNTTRQYLVSLGILLGFLIFFEFFKNKLFIYLERWARKTKTDLDDEIIADIKSIPTSLYIVAAIFFSIQAIHVHPILSKVIEVLFITLVIYWSANVVSKLIEYGLYKLAKKKGGSYKKKNTTYLALALIAKLILWTTGFLLVLSNLGVNISALIASLGIGGIAIALAVQNVLGDIFSSFSIYLDKPFEIGDYIIVGDHSGTVKKIGLKSTRIEALQGEEIVISNNELTTTRIQNFKTMKKRRIAFQIGLTYDTSSTKLKKVPKLIESIIEKTKNAEFSRAHFHEFGDFALKYEIVYYIHSGEYQDYMDAQEAINLEIHKAFEKEKIDMAFPTQTLHLEKA